MSSPSVRTLTLSFVAAALLLLACDEGAVTPPVVSPPDDTLPPPIVTPVTAASWVDWVDWDQRTVVEVSMVESGAALSYSPAELTFEAGKPYVLRIVNSVDNDSKHYWSPEGTSFFKAIATRKIQTAEAEYKAPYFDAVELQIGGALEIFFVPVLAGTYDIVCTITGHKAAGMFGTATITGGEGYQLDLEVAPDYNPALSSDPRRSGSHDVWSNAVDKTVEMFESADFSQLGYEPPNLELTQGLGYKLRLENDEGHASKHYYTATEFYKTVVMRKVEDSQAEIKAPYLNAVELLIGGETTLFVVPTQLGTFETICTITGHVQAGMEGTITVSPLVATPVTSSDWVSFVDWDQRTVVEVTMVESAGGALSYSPSDLTLEAGKPYVLRIINPADNDSKHYWSPEGSSFYQAIATRKIETADAEYKAPYFDAVELLVGGTLDIYFVPVLAGTYDIICTITGHQEAGMVGTATITGGDGYQLDLEVAADFDPALMTDARRSGSHAVWATAVDVTVDMFESADFTTLGYVPPDLDLTQGVGYKLRLQNAPGHQSKHYYTASELYKTLVLRKAEDSQAEIKAPYLKAVELLIGGATTLFNVPTKTGTYEVICTITGHVASGMKGTISVAADGG
jgi:uncharacterized cupredoxin-like copper-binding protein